MNFNKKKKLNIALLSHLGLTAIFKRQSSNKGHCFETMDTFLEH